jgi:peptidoglycan/xylan/chitin deacetylase (PgdA/CDA1 family)
LNTITNSIVRYSWRFPFARALSPRQTVICLYHGVPARDGAGFEQHVRFLTRHCDLATPEDSDKVRGRFDRPRILLTFDDGFRNHAEVVAPILRRYEVPAIFFVPSRHTWTGQYLWFSYLRALEQHFKDDGFVFRGEFIDMARDRRHASISRLSETLLALTPHPSSMYQAIEQELPPLEDFVGEEALADEYAGLTVAQISELASDSLFTIGAHTVDHPLLTRCSLEEAVRQMDDNKKWLEQITNQPCATFAYPSGNYDASVLSACRSLGFSHGYATTPVLGRDGRFEVPRLGIYSPSLDTLGFKVHWGFAMRAIGLRIG